MPRRTSSSTRNYARLAIPPRTLSASASRTSWRWRSSRAATAAPASRSWLTWSARQASSPRYTPGRPSWRPACSMPPTARASSETAGAELLPGSANGCGMPWVRRWRGSSAGTRRSGGSLTPFRRFTSASRRWIPESATCSSCASPTSSRITWIWARSTAPMPHGGETRRARPCTSAWTWRSVSASRNWPPRWPKPSWRLFRPTSPWLSAAGTAALSSWLPRRTGCDGRYGFGVFSRGWKDASGSRRRSGWGTALRLSQLEALDLARCRLRERRDEFDPAWVLVGGELVLDEALEFVLQARRCRVAILEHDEGLGLDEPVRVLVADHGGLEDRRMAHEGVLHLDRRDPDAPHLQHVVGAAAVPEVAVVVLVVLVARLDPVAKERGLGLLVLVPVIGHGRVALDLQVADLALRHGPPLVVHDSCLVTRHRQPSRARPRLAGPVREEDVEDLGRADAVENLDAEAVAPPLVEILWQRLTGRHAAADRGQVPACLGFLDLQHRGIERRHPEEDRGPVPVYDLEHGLGQRPVRVEHGLRAHAHREVHVVAEAVGKEELGRREGSIVRRDAQHLEGVRIRAHDHVVLEVDGALGESRRARGIEPEAGVVLGCLRGLERGSGAAEPSIEADL